MYHTVKQAIFHLEGTLKYEDFLTLYIKPFC